MWHLLHPLRCCVASLAPTMNLITRLSLAALAPAEISKPLASFGRSPNGLWTAPASNLWAAMAGAVGNDSPELVRKNKALVNK